MKFGFVIEKGDGKNEFTIISRNEGLPQAEVIVVARQWLKSYRDDFKKSLRDGIRFLDTDEETS